MIKVLAVMTAVSFGFRILPFLFSTWLKRWTFLDKLGATLPVCLLLLLVAHNVQHMSCGLPEVIGLVVVVFAQIFFLSILLSMLLGVLFHQILMRFF